MTAFSLSANTNIDALTGKAGGDTYDTNGFILTIDQDSRVGLNQTTSTTLGSITINATKGGDLNIDGTQIWIIGFSGGSGVVPAWNTIITQAGQTGTGKLIGVYTGYTVASAATGAAMPATGFIKIKQTSGTFAAGALTGITATSAGTGRVGWIEIVGDEAATINANRLGTVNITGAWYAIGTTNGTANQTMQIPNNGLLRYAAGVYIEHSAGSGTYEFYPNAGTTTTTGTEDTRGKVVWIDNTGLVRIGNSGAATNGYVPATGCAVVIGNVFLENCTTAARTANVIPNATVATRYDFTTTGGGVINIDKCNMAWYLSCMQAYSCNVSYSCFVDAIYLQEIATPMTWDHVGVGNKPTTALLVSPLQMFYCYAGGTFSDCTFARVSLAASGAYTVVLQDIVGFTFTRCTFRANTIQGNATVYSIYGTRIKNTDFVNHTTIEGANNLLTCDDVNFTDTVYCNCVSGTTVTTYAVYVWNISNNTINCTFSGLTWPVTNTHPYTAILTAATGCSGIKLRNIGTYALPLTMGSANICGLVYSLATNCSDFKIQRVYVSATRTGIMTGDNSSHEVTEENVWGDYADAVDVMAVLNMTRKGMGGTGALTGQVSVYGTHWRDGHTSTTAGRIAILMNEPTALTTAQVTLTGGAAFTSAGGLYMPVIGQTATFEMPEYIIGHTGFANSALVMAGGTATNYTYEYAIDKNDGGGFSTLTSSAYTATQLGTALNGITGINALLGFKLKIKITTGTTNTTAITSVYMTTTSTTTTQAYQYTLDPAQITFTGLKAGSEVRCYFGTDPATSVEIGGIESSGTSLNFSHSYAAQVGYIQVFHVDYQPVTYSNYTYGTNDVVLIQQTIDRQYARGTVYAPA